MALQNENPVIRKMKEKQRSNESSRKKLVVKNSNIVRYDSQLSSKQKLVQLSTPTNVQAPQNERGLDSFMNESIDYPDAEKSTQNQTETTKDKSGVNSQPVTHRQKELTRNMHFRAVENILYTDLLSEETVLSPNYKPPKNPDDKKEICFNSPHNLEGKIKKFIFPASELAMQSQSMQKIGQHTKQMSFVHRY